MATQPEIVPRWEWRVFGDGFETAERALSALTAGRSRESAELYLLSTHSDASVKIRDDLMDVKQLLRVDHGGLELWTPVMKATFPLSAADLTSVLVTLGVPIPTLERGAYTEAELEAEIVGPRPDAMVVRVHKRRSHFDLDGCPVELTHLTVDGTVTTTTIVVESSDDVLVSATVRELGLDHERNVSMAKGLKSLVGLGTRRCAVIDVGTNSVKFHVGERRADGSLHAVADRAEVTRLGEGLADSGRLADAAMQRTTDAITGMADEARSLGADVVAVGTAGLRVASNSAEFLDAVAARSGVTVEVISGEEEGRLAYLAAMTALPVAHGELVVFDSGGGSTQFSFGRATHVDQRFSLDVGAVRIAERFGLARAVEHAVLDEVASSLAAELDVLHDHPKPDAVIAMGGTATNLAAVQHGLARYDADVVNGTVLALGEIDRQIERYRSMDVDERRTIVGLQPKRAEVILAGACIVRAVLTALGHDSLTVCDRGLRHGLVAERLAT